MSNSVPRTTIIAREYLENKKGENDGRAKKNSSAQIYRDAVAAKEEGKLDVVQEKLDEIISKADDYVESTRGQKCYVADKHTTMLVFRNGIRELVKGNSAGGRKRKRKTKRKRRRKSKKKRRGKKRTRRGKKRTRRRRP